MKISDLIHAARTSFEEEERFSGYVGSSYHRSAPPYDDSSDREDVLNYRHWRRLHDRSGFPKSQSFIEHSTDDLVHGSSVCLMPHKSVLSLLPGDDSYPSPPKIITGNVTGNSSRSRRYASLTPPNTASDAAPALLYPQPQRITDPSSKKLYMDSAGNRNALYRRHQEVTPESSPPQKPLPSPLSSSSAFGDVYSSHYSYMSSIRHLDDGMIRERPTQFYLDHQSHSGMYINHDRLSPSDSFEWNDSLSGMRPHSSGGDPEYDSFSDYSELHDDDDDDDYGSSSHNRGMRATQKRKGKTSILRSRQRGYSHTASAYSYDSNVGNLCDENEEGTVGFYRCPIRGCYQSFENHRDLSNHTQTHMADRPHACPQCSARFRRRQDMYRHVRSVHDDPSSRPHPCENEGCYMRFARADGLAAHMRTCQGGQSNKRRRRGDEHGFHD